MSETEATKDRLDALATPNSKVATIPGVKLSVSVGKDVIVRIPGVERSYRGKVVGYSPYDYIIASVRLPSSVRSDLNLGGQVIIKYIHKGTVYGFKAPVLRAISSPTSLLFFEYPAMIEKIELRRDTREKCNIDGKLQTESADHECLVVNISTTGCKVSVRAGTRDAISELAVDDTLVVFADLGPEGTIKLPIAVRNISREQGIMTMGAMFLDLTDKEAERIKSYLERKRRLTR